MRASSCWMRDCVCSTVPLSVSTFELTVATSVRTNSFVAQAGAMATVRDSNDAARRLLRICDFLLNDYSTRRGHVSASRMYDKVLLLCSNLERVPARSGPRLEGDEVLVPVSYTHLTLPTSDLV